MKEVLNIKDLTISFKSDGEETVAVNGLNMKLEEGAIVGIVGESGSGKSVTALAVMRLLTCPPAVIKKGEIWLTRENTGSIDVLKLPEREMQNIRGRHISMIFQEPMTSLNPVYKCGPQVLEILLRHTKIKPKDAKKKVIALFKEVLLPRPEDIFNSYPHQISGGQKQRVMIAMAVACNPSVIIADEPTTALDVTVQKSILELLKKISAAHRISILFITHDLGVVAEIANRVVVMYKGACVEEDSVETIFHRPVHPYTKGLLACRPDMTKRLRKLPVVADFLNTDDNASELLHALKRNNIPAEERKKSHETIYSHEPLLKIQNLSKNFQSSKGLLSFKRQKSFKALNNVSFEVYAGETLGLAGESGCGKTTLGRTLLRLIEPSSGKIFYKEKDITQLNNRQLRQLRKDIQIIFQDPYASLNPRLTVGQAITEPMEVHKIHSTGKQRKDKAIDLLEKVGLETSHYNRYPHEFSGGQRQRIVIARTLALNPKFIICDESVSALDVSIQAQVLNLLNNLKTEFGFTYIFISHDLSVVKFLADRIIIMKDGSIVEVNEADELYANPQNTYTKELLASIPKGL